MAEYTALFDFQDGFGYLDYTSYLTGEGFTRNLCIGVDGSHEYSTLNITLKPNTTLFHKYIQATNPILVKIKKDNLAYFTGSFRSNGSFAINEKLQNFQIQVLDNTSLLEKKPVEPQVWRNLVICDNTSPSSSLVHKLLNLAGIDSTGYSISVYDGTIFDVFKIDETELISNVMEKILFEYGLTYYFDVEGKFKIKDIAPDTIFPLVHFTNENLIQPLGITKNDTNKDGVMVSWAELTSKTDQLIYRQIITPETDKKPISPLLYFPANGNNRDVFQSYKIIETDDNTKLYHSYNHSLVWNADNGIVVDKQIFNSDKAQILFHNTAGNDGTIRYLNQFDIRADVFLQADVTETKIDGANQEDYKATYIYEQASAEKLTRILVARQKFGSFKLSIQSKQSFPIGTFASITDSTTGISLTILLLSKTETDGNPIITYTAQNISGLLFISSSISSSVTSIPSQIGQAGEDGEDAYRVEIISNNGSVFRMGQDFTTILEARVIQGSEDISNNFINQDFRWTRTSGIENEQEDAIWNSANYSIGGRFLTITKEDVIGRSVFNCELLHKRR